MNVDRARGLRLGMTDAEQALWYRLRNRQLDGCKFRRQHEIDRYVVDFACTERMLVVELDGGQHQEQQDYDNARTRYLQAKGYRVLRFWNNDVLTNIESVLEVMMEVLASPGPSPQPFPRRGEGARLAGEIDE
ncbi:endonuclease domain-containing protein [Frateuria hangzhouensis]|uniref:endonuclease domain-containing protein n=1 Tax=Frateuria hangzhouensis TaxID=2995589 RepID=UPI002261027B|nr:endonuclease domain-containing protein [Frateuria sp. STR12]MCX7513007.1 endonuclease domain-containing protein [Frateuria sp. STR12]